MSRMAIQDYSTPNHEHEAMALRDVLAGMRLILGANQTPDDWSRTNVYSKLLTVSGRVRNCPISGSPSRYGHGKVAEWCEKVIAIFEAREWSKLDVHLTAEGQRHLDELYACRSNPMKY